MGDIRRLVLDASPLIVLTKGGLVDLLARVFSDVYVTPAVLIELEAGAERDNVFKTVSNFHWLHQLPATKLADRLLECGSLGLGESEVLSAALAMPSAAGAMIDDAAARRCARLLDVAFIGTGGFLVLAKRKGLIESVSTALDRVRGAGLWVDEDLANLLKTRAGE